ncbi:MAG: hypothetical protein VCB07_00080, partial [Gammaproteobacteria bacterium]
MTYQEALVKTDPASNDVLESGGAAERIALERFADFVSEMSPDSMREKVQRVYAADAYFNDTLKEIVGALAIEEYMARSMEAT